MFQDVPSFIFSYQPIIHSSKKNFQQNPFLISLFQNFKSSADTFLFLFYFLIYILGKSIDQKSRSLVFKTFHLNLLHKTYPLFSPRSFRKSAEPIFILTRLSRHVHDSSLFSARNVMNLSMNTIHKKVILCEETRFEGR